MTVSSVVVTAQVKLKKKVCVFDHSQTILPAVASAIAKGQTRSVVNTRRLIVHTL